METTILAIAVICLGVATLMLNIRLAKAERRISLWSTLQSDLLKLMFERERAFLRKS